MAVLETFEWGDRDADPVLCLHGVTGHGARFRKLAEERLPGHRVVGVSYRGHSRSTYEPPWGVEQHVADLLETAASLGIETGAWLGHSFGGKLVAELAAREPDRVSKAVLLDPAMHIEPAMCLERAELTRQGASFGSVDEAIAYWEDSGALHTTPRAFLEEEAADHLVEGDDGRLRWRFCVPAAIAAWSAMAEPAPPWPSCPTLVVIGELSWLPVDVPAAPHLAVVRVPGGHGVLWDDFDATADAIAAFLSG